MTDAKIRLDPDLLTPRDLRRARDILKGRNPFELLDDPIDRLVLITWCLRSREDASFTWEQAEDTPFSAFEQAEPEQDPPTPGTENGPGNNGSERSKRKRLAAEPAPS